MAQKFTVPITVKQLTSAGSDALTVYVDADTFARLKVEAGGRLVWGSGSGSGDVTLYRESADILKTDDSFKVGGLLTVTAASGDEGGEINLAKPVTNSSISGNVAIDIFQNKIRIFETGGSNRGAYIDLTAASTGVGSDLLTGTGGGATTLDELTDVTAPSPSSGDYLKYNGSAWVNDPINLGTDTTGNYVSDVSAGTGISVSHTPGEGSTPSVSLNATLDNLSNVTVPSPTTNDVLQYNGTAWVNVAATSVGATNLDGLTDVVITTPEEFQSLTYDGTNWVNSYASTVTYVRNAESTTLTTGTVVYLYGATGDHATVKRADKGSDTTSSKTVGLVGAPITASNNGPVITRGYVDGIDLSVGYSPGDVLWLGSNGAFTKTKATAPDHLVFVGVVVRATNNGIVYVATQNGYELDELHNVAASSPSPGDVLKYNGSLWVNDQIDLGTDTVGDYVSSVSGGTGISVNFTPGEGVGASVSLNATLDNLSDVTVPTPSSGDFLKWNGTAWVNDAIDLGTDTTGNYVQSLVAGTGITLTNATASEGGTPTIAVTANTYQPLDADLTAIAGLAGTSGVLRKTAADTWTLDTSTFVTTADTGTVTSAMIANGTIVDADINSAAAIALSKLSTTGASVGDVVTYNGSTWTAASAAAGGAKVTVSDTPPSSPTTGDMWFESDTSRTYVYYDSFWVEIGGVAPAATVSDTAPTSPATGQVWFNSLNGGTYVYYSGAWAEIGAVPVNALLNTIDAKGDLFVGTADNTVNRLGVGTNGQYLTANSATATGLEWKTVDALPSQSGNTGKYLTTNGTLASWATVVTDVMVDTKNAALIVMDIGV